MNSPRRGYGSARSQRGHDSKKRNDRPNAVMPFGYIARDRQYVLDDRPYLCLIDGQLELSRADLARDTIAIFRHAQSLTAAIELIHNKYGVYARSHPRSAKASKSFILDDNIDGSDDIAISSPRSGNRSRFSWTHKGLRNWLFNPVFIIFKNKSGQFDRSNHSAFSHSDSMIA